MLRYVKWAAITVFWLVVVAFLHYTLPQNDVVRITDTYEKRVDFDRGGLFWSRADGSSTSTPVNRDVFFIQAHGADGDAMVYRNEDTGWSWPPYFKFDSSTLQAEAADLRSSSSDPVWVAVTHYGWRLEFLSVFPNALSVRVVEGPDVTLIPWKAIIILILLAAAIWAIWVRWRRFRRNRLDPVFEEMGDGFDAAGDRLASRRERLGRWWRGR